VNPRFSFQEQFLSSIKLKKKSMKLFSQKIFKGKFQVSSSNILLKSMYYTLIVVSSTSTNHLKEVIRTFKRNSSEDFLKLDFFNLFP